MILAKSKKLRKCCKTLTAELLLQVRRHDVATPEFRVLSGAAKPLQDLRVLMRCHNQMTDGDAKKTNGLSWTRPMLKLCLRTARYCY